MSLLRSLFLLTLPLLSLLSGCAVNPATGEHDFVLMTEAEELRLGQSHRQQIDQEYPQVGSQTLQEYVQSVGMKLARVSHRPNLDYRFRVIDTADLNAFALPGGGIYIHRGLLAYLNSEAELAAVLAHEIGHVTARHSVQQQSMASAGGLLSAVAAAYTGIGAVGDLGNLANTALVRGYGREHELEADGLGAEYLARAGYDPTAMISMLELLKNHQLYHSQQAAAAGRSVQSYHGLFASHPSHDQRLHEIVGAVPHQNGIQNRTPYLKQLEGLAFGDSEANGVVVDQAFYHKPLNIRISLPPGWRVQNQPDALIALAPDESAFLMLKPAAPVADTTPEQYLGQWLGQYRWDAPEALGGRQVQGYSAQIYRDKQPPLRAAVFFHQQRVYQLLGAVKDSARFTTFDPVMLTSIRSFGTLSPAEARLATGHHIHLLRSPRGQSYEQLARQSVLPEDAANQLRLLNADWPDGQPEPGQWLKTITR